MPRIFCCPGFFSAALNIKRYPHLSNAFNSKARGEPFPALHFMSVPAELTCNDPFNGVIGPVLLNRPLSQSFERHAAIIQRLMEWEDVVHPGRHAQEDFAHHGNVGEMLAVERRLAVGTAGHQLGIRGEIGVGDFNDHRNPTGRW